jgi:hypothetical protein
VTGSPGAGKSALLGVLVCAAHPQLRDHLLGHLPHGELPGRNDRLAAVHARGRRLEELLGSLGRQLGLAEPAGGWTPVAFQDAMIKSARAGERPIVVLDALDEADQPKDVVDLLLLPLARARVGDNLGACRLLVATRPWEEFDGLLEQARESGCLWDLDTVPASVLREDVARYAERVLATSPLYDHAGMRTLRELLAGTIATRLAASGADGDGRAAGAFLVAGLYVHHFERL